MKDILAKAEELGRLIAASERFNELNAARQEVSGDSALQADIQALNEHSRKLEELQRQTKPIEPEDKRQLRSMQEKVTRNPKMQRLARAEADFSELMNRVSRAIHGQLAPPHEREA